VGGELRQIGAQIRAMSITARALVLFAVVALAAAGAAWAVYDSNDLSRVYAVGISAALTAASSLVALVLSLIWHGTPNGVVGALGGMMVGLGIPLAAAIVVQRRDGDLAHAGFYGWIVVFYLISLTVKTLLVAPGYAPADPYAPVDPYAPGDPGAPRRNGDSKSPAKKSGV
jgi:hypothetical protein